MVTTNPSAQTAIRQLRGADRSLDQTRDRIATGLKVARAQDNPAFFLVAATQRSDIIVTDGIQNNLAYALGAVRTAQAAQDELVSAIDNIVSAIVTLETGTASAELERVIEDQVEIARQIVRGTSFNGLNLLERRNVETFTAAINRSAAGLEFDQIFVEGAGLGETGNQVNLVPPFPGATVLDLNAAGAGDLAATFGTTIPDTPDLNQGGPFEQKTFGIAFETGPDVTTRQVIYEQGGGGRGLNIWIEAGQVNLGVYNAAATAPGETNWGFRQVFATVEPNTRYTSQMVFDGNVSDTGTMAAYLDGDLITTTGGVGRLFNHTGDIGVGQVDGSTRFSASTVGNGPDPFLGLIDKIVQYNAVFVGDDFDQVTTYLAEDWLITGGIQYYVGNERRQDQASLFELLDAVLPVDQDGFTTSGALEVLNAAKRKVNRAFADLGAAEGRLERQSEFLRNLSASMSQGVAALVEADLAEESARLEALRVGRELVVDGLSIANQRIGTVLQLFR